MIPDDVVQEVLARADILQVVGDYVTLKRAGSSFKGLCPFHGEKTPSFHVTPSKGLFYCFGCGEGGSAVDFVMRLESLSFPEAIEHIGRRFGVEVESRRETSEAARDRRRERDVVQGAVDTAEQFFRAQLGQSEAARSYLQQRGLSAEAIETFRLGFAPDAWDALLTHLQRVQIEPFVAERAGLLVPRRGDDDAPAQGGERGYYDRFRNRVIFPVIDARGMVVAFGGRTLAKDVGAKYINSPETPLFVKGKSLYGIHAAKEEARRSRQIILVEGNVDVVRLWDAGFHATVAPMGTALTDDQARLIARFAERVIVLFDGDAAGKRAALRSIGPLQRAELEARVALLPQGEDPDSFVGVYGAEGLQEILDSAELLAQWAVDQACHEVLAKPVGSRSQPLQELDELMQGFSVGVVRQHYLTEAARRLGLRPQELAQQLGWDRAPEGPRRASVAHEPRSAPAEVVECDAVEFELLKLLLDSADRLREFVKTEGLLLIRDRNIVELLHTVHDAYAEASDESDPDVRELIKALPDGQVRGLGFSALMHERVVESHLEKDWYRGAVAQLTERWVERETLQLANHLNAAQASGDLEALHHIKERFAQLDELRRQSRNDRKIDWMTLSGN